MTELEGGKAEVLRKHQAKQIIYFPGKDFRRYEKSTVTNHE